MSWQNGYTYLWGMPSPDRRASRNRTGKTLACWALCMCKVWKAVLRKSSLWKKSKLETFKVSYMYIVISTKIISSLNIVPIIRFNYFIFFYSGSCILRNSLPSIIRKSMLRLQPSYSGRCFHRTKQGVVSYKRTINLCKTATKLKLMYYR